jgi:phosphate transport system substrate-binding protein
MLTHSSIALKRRLVTWQSENKKGEKEMTKLVRPVLFVLAALGLVLAACGAPATEAPAPTAAPVEPTVAPTEDPMAMYMPDAVSGNIVTAGSSTVFPLSERMAELFKQEGFAGDLTIDSIGTGGGFERFCKTGETDIANASRKIKDTEAENCKALGRTPIAFRVGTDALSVVVSKENTFLKDVTLEQLALIFSTAEKWSDVDPSWPAEPILRFTPGTDSGTFDYFVEKVMDPAYVKDATADKGKGEAALLAAKNLQLSEDDNVLVQGVEGSPYAIGFFGFAYYQENKDKLNVLSVGGVTPDEKTAEDNTYPISRPLFIYSDARIMKDKPQVAAFIHFYLANVNDEIVDVGYFPASQAAIDESLKAWEEALK